MKLIEVEVKLFKNMLDSTPVEIESDITCLVGKNESGKTAFLQALYRLKPAHKSAVFNVQQQYPAWLEKAHRRDTKLEEVRPIKAKFTVEAADVASFEAQFGAGSLLSKEITYERQYDGQGWLDYKTDEAKVVAFIVSGIDIPADFKERATKVSQMAELEKLREDIEANGGEACKTACEAIDEKQSEVLGESENLRKAMLAKINQLMPAFFYFDEYSSLPGTIQVTELLQKKREDLDEEEATARSLLDLAGAEKDYLLNADYEVRKRELENVANSLTNDVLEYWSTNPELRVHMDFTQRTVQAQPPKQGHYSVIDELKLRLWDDRHLLSLPFDQRSSGFRWFFSFLAAFSHYEQEGGAPVIILLDEPGLGLHARAQHDFLRFIEERLAKKCQVIYTTHSPFLVQPAHLERARLVQDEGRKKGSRITSDVLSIDKDTLFPLQGALGYDLAQHLFVAPHNLVVEGTSDYTYLLLLSDHLKGAKRVGLDDRWSIIPVGGADLVPSFVALLGHHLAVTVVLDSRKEGHQRLLKMADQGILERNRIIPIGEITKTKLADIEDLFTVDEYLKLYNAAFGASIKASDLKGTDPIVSRIARLIGVDRFDHGQPADALLRDRDKFLPTLSAATLGLFEDLFKRINATLQ